MQRNGQQRDAATQHVIQLTSSPPSVSSKHDNRHCDGPSPDQCFGSGDDDHGGGGALTRAGVVKGGRAQLNCGGGGDMPGLYCDEEWIEIDISYDGGVTWSQLWAGWGNVCDIWAE